MGRGIRRWRDSGEVRDGGDDEGFGCGIYEARRIRARKDIEQCRSSIDRSTGSEKDQERGAGERRLWDMMPVVKKVKKRKAK